ncbi:hypothetical protein [Streptomyces sp. NPDC058657]|uniref:hypothetical protein n=1 Tax=unclassified Streptomyces TaxID=2593676 RepID=UPI003656F270
MADLHNGLPAASRTTVPPLDDDHQALLEELAGAHPAFDQILSGLRNLALAHLTPGQTQTVLHCLGGSTGEGTDLLGALAATVRRLTDPDTNPALRTLPAEQQDLAREYGAQYAHYDTEFAPRDLIAEANAAISGI